MLTHGAAVYEPSVEALKVGLGNGSTERAEWRRVGEVNGNQVLHWRGLGCRIGGGLGCIGGRFLLYPILGSGAALAAPGLLHWWRVPLHWQLVPW